MQATWDDGDLLIVGASNPEDLAVVPVHALALDGPLAATAGTWTSEPGAVRFTPFFPPLPATVHAIVALTGSRWTELTRVTVPAVELEPSTQVVNIDPGGDRLPANLLRISVTFSAPMEQGSASGRFHLLADDGAELIGALLPMPPELWDRPRRRLTVLLDPGRIKRWVTTEYPGRAAARTWHVRDFRGGRPTHRCGGCTAGDRRGAQVSN